MRVCVCACVHYIIINLCVSNTVDPLCNKSLTKVPQSLPELCVGSVIGGLYRVALVPVETTDVGQGWVSSTVDNCGSCLLLCGAGRRGRERKWEKERGEGGRNR